MTPDQQRMYQHRQALVTDWQKIKRAFSDTAIDVVDIAEDIVKMKSSRVEEYTRQKPLQSLGIAIFIGFVLGCWWKR